MLALAGRAPWSDGWGLHEYRGGVLRPLGVTACALGALLGAFGVTQEALFAAPSLLKYSFTVAAPLLGVLLLTIERPLQLAVAVTIVCIPFGGAKATFGGERISLLLMMLALSSVVAIVSGPRPRLPAFGMLTIACVGLLAAPLVIGSDVGGAVVVGAMVLVGWLVSRVAGESEHGVHTVYWAVVVAAAIQAAIAIYEFKTKHHVNLYGSAGAGVSETTYFGTSAGRAGELHTTQRPSGTLYDPISLGNVLAMSCPVLVVLAASTRVFLTRIALVIAGLLIVTALALSFSRFSWIGAGAGTVIACLALPHWYLRLSGLLTSAAIVVLAAALALSVAGPTLIKRFETIGNPTHAANRTTANGDREREEAWHAETKTFLEHPLAGVGLGRIRFSLARYLPHVKEATNGQNTYLQVAAEAGLLGLAALALIVGGAAWGIYGGLHGASVPAAAALGAGVAILIVWLTDVTIRYTPVAAFFAILLGVASALPRLARQPSTSTNR
jgi:hypothetical protein